MSAIRRWGMLATHRDGNNNMRETPRHQNEEQQSVAVEMGKPATGRRRGSGAVDSDQGRECGADGKESPRRTGVSREEFTALASRVDRMELSVDLIEARLDSVLSKIQSMEEEKVKHDELLAMLISTKTDPAAEIVEAAEQKQIQNRWDAGDTTVLSGQGDASPEPGVGLRKRKKAQS